MKSQDHDFTGASMIKGYGHQMVSLMNGGNHPPSLCLHPEYALFA